MIIVQIRKVKGKVKQTHTAMHKHYLPLLLEQFLFVSSAAHL